jgi:hypothetical protein
MLGPDIDAGVRPLAGVYFPAIKTGHQERSPVTILRADLLQERCRGEDGTISPQ